VDATKTRTWKNLHPARARASAEGAEDAASQQASATFIDSGAVFEGTLELSGDFHIDSEFRGEIETDGEIVVGPSGSVEGNIRARQVVIQGAVVGTVAARRLFVLRSGGRLHGDVETACLEIEKHAFFQGTTRMTRPQSTSRSADTGVPAGKGAKPSSSSAQAGASFGGPPAPTTS
jgi:cytoskeletal protein CcmA (bactofilin family)